MKASKFLIPTTKDDPQDAVVASHKLMVRAGLIRKSGAGLYFYLPMGLRILKKIEQIVREEMDISGALEFELPILTPSEYWKDSGRWDKMGKEMMRLVDRHDNESCLGPTHEESFCVLIKPMLRSYKDLPLNVYQIHTKFRDEIRPRYGVIRSREFIMKDAYSFHLNDASLDETYQKMRSTYRKIFQRMGLGTIPVQADSGNMGGSASEEFMVVSPIGEETLMLCGSCHYSSNLEKTPVIKNNISQISSNAEILDTPGIRSIDELSTFLKVSPSDCLKAVALQSEDRSFLVYIPGNRELNENKCKNYFKSGDLIPMETTRLQSFGLVTGYIGILDSIPKDLEIAFDSNLSPDLFYVSGANAFDKHKTGVSIPKNQWEAHQTDLTQAVVGDACPVCGSALHSEKGIEVGHIFKLGTKYTDAFGIKVLDQTGKPSLLTMGCYGIGVNRCMATVIEQCNDDKGIYWPISIAPFAVVMVSISKTKEELELIEPIYQAMLQAGIEVIWDDRDLGAGFKFKDAELIGYPVRVTAGKGFFEKKEISIHTRHDMKETLHSFTEPQKLVHEVKEILKGLQAKLLASE